MKKLATLCVLVAALSAAACSSMPSLPALPEFTLPFGDGRSSKADEPAPLPGGAATRDRIGRAIDLLGAGKADTAKGELQKALEQSPKDATALRLLAQIETDPVALLGSDSREYVVTAGDTMSVLADKHLGDPLMFYALSRYNGMASPNALAVGKVLRIPVRPGKQPDVPNTVSASVVDMQSPRAAASSADVESSNAMRLQALELLNRGDVTKALGLLRKAEAINRTDPAIQRDIQRALRIQSALGGE